MNDKLYKLYKAYKQEMKCKKAWYKKNISQKLFSGRDLRDEMEAKMHKLAIKLIEASNFNIAKDRNTEKGMLEMNDKKTKISCRAYRCHDFYSFNIIPHDYDLDDNKDGEYEIHQLKGVLPEGFTSMAFMIGKKIKQMEDKKEQISNNRVAIPFKKDLHIFDSYADDDDEDGIKTLKAKEIVLGSSVSVGLQGENNDRQYYDSYWEVLCDEDVFESIKINMQKLLDKNEKKVEEIVRIQNKITKMIEVDYKKIMITADLKMAE